MKKLTLVLISFLLLSHFETFAQRNVLQLNFTAEYYGQYMPIDSIFIENLTLGCDTMLYYPDTTMMLDYITGINDDNGFDEGGFGVFQNRPNPFPDQTSIQVLISETDQVTISVTNLLGQRVAFFEKELASGTHSLVFFSGSEKYYILSVTFRGLTKAIKMVNMNSQCGNHGELFYEGIEHGFQWVKDTQIRSGFQYNLGDQLRFIGYSKSPLGVPASDVIEDTPTSNEDYIFEIVEGIPCPGIPALFYEGQTYTTVQIANQCWLKENLNVGTMINTSSNQSNNGATEKYCYDDDATNCDVYGGLYQWSEMMQYYSAQGEQGICPAGWHIPTDNEFISLTNYLGGEDVACGKMKETGTVHWTSPNYGATNQSGFTAFPGGYFDPDYGFSWPSLSFYGSFWTSSESSDAPNAWARDLGYEDEFITRYEFFKTAGMSVRCLKDVLSLPLITTAPVFNITQTTATCGGEVSDDGGAEVTERGVCWSTNQNPTISDDHTTDGSGIGMYTSYLTGLTPNTPYFVRAYATNSVGTAYGNEVIFLTLSGATFACGDYLMINHNAGNVVPVSKSVIYGTVANIPGETTKCWITGNLGADHQAVAFDDSTEASSGWYWQFNHKQGYKHDGITRTPNSIWISNIDEDSDWLAENDPCAIELGNGWRIPTMTEWTNVDDAGNWINWNGPWNSGLRLHAAGLLGNTNGNLYDRGSSGLQWSNTQYNSSVGWSLNFSNGFSLPFSFLKAGGFSLRCIKEASISSTATLFTSEITEITQTTATCGGEVTDDGGAEVTERGVCWGTNQNPTISDNHTIDGSGIGMFTSYMMGLVPNTPYFVRAYATNSAGTAYGNEVTFSTLPVVLPIVTTTTITNITDTSAKSGGIVVFDGGSQVTSRGVCWSVLANPTIDDSLTYDGTGTGSFVSNLTGLAPNTTYYVRAYASNSAGTGYGDEESFTTLDSTGFTCGDMVNYEGQNYNTILIGFQCWFKESLNVGTMINAPQSQTNNGILEKYCYDNTALNCDEYGGLYQWDEMMQYSNTPGTQGICPSTGGWHLPDETDWTALIDYLGEEWDVGGMLKEAGLIHWQFPNTGATNSSGFTGLPGGGLAFGDFTELTTLGVWWSSTEEYAGSSFAYAGLLMHNDASIGFGISWKTHGLSVRCMKQDNSATIPTVITSPVTGITQNSAICGGEVTDNGFEEVTARGICWSLHPNPTLEDNYTSDGTGTGIFVSNMIDLIQDTTYYVRAYATNLIGTAYGDELTFMTLQATTFMCGDIVEYEGEFYPTILIGTQCWFKKNLNVGTMINSAFSQTNNGIIEKCCYANLASNCEEYGGLYQWDEMMQYSSTPGVQGICPSTDGWHLPTQSDWTILKSYLGGVSIAGGKLKEAGLTHWQSPNTGATNSSGFTGLPGGSLAYYSFSELSYLGLWWSSTEQAAGSLNGFAASLMYNEESLLLANKPKINGFSVRCMKLDNSAVIPTVITSPVTGITQNSAICGGEVTDNGFQEVTARGVCWSLHPNPTLDDTHTFDGTGAGIFVSYLIDLIQDTTYYVRAYATNVIGTAYGDEQTFMTLQSTTFVCGDVFEYEGELYPTVMIGTQCWFKKNLNVGTRINLNLYQANNGTIEKYCYDNLEANCDVYGGLYQWNEMMQYTTQPGEQGICPPTDGWHLPTFEEWTTLTNYLGGLGSAGGKLKEQGTSHWLPPNTGATNSSGFTGLPGGIKTFWGGNCDWLGWYGYYWTSSPYETGAAWYWELRYDQTAADRNIIEKTYGHSVRCVK